MTSLSLLKSTGRGTNSNVSTCISAYKSTFTLPPEYFSSGKHSVVSNMSFLLIQLSKELS